MSVDLPALLDRFSVAADTAPAHALQLWTSIVAHRDWPATALEVRLAALDDLAAAQSGVGDHDGAVATAEAALAATPRQDPDHAYRLGGLATCLEARHRQTGESADLERLVAVRRAAVDRTAPRSAELVVRLGALGAAHRIRWRCTGESRSLDDAVDALHQAVAAAALLRTDLARSAGNLAVALSDRFDAWGRSGDLDSAIRAVQQALRAGPDESTDRGTHLLLLATLLSDRYDHTGRIADLHDALTTAHAAADISLDDGRERARLQNLLGVLELDRHQIEPDRAALGEAVRWARSAVETTDPADPSLAGYLTNLGAAHRLTFEATFPEVDGADPDRADPDDADTSPVDIDVASLRAAVDAHRRAVELAVGDRFDRPMHLTNLGTVLTDAALVLPDEFDLSEAVAVLQEAADATEAESPHSSGRWNNLAMALRAVADRTGLAATDRTRARAAFHTACTHSTRPEDTLSAAINWSVWASERQSWPEIARAAQHGLAAADVLRSTQLSRRDRTAWLRVADGLATAGTLALARLEDPRGAVLLAERGRALLLADALAQDRARLDRLAVVRPDLATRFRAAVAARNAVSDLPGWRSASPPS